MAVYGAGLPAFVLQKVISPVYYAREDTRTPFRYAVHAMLVNAAVAHRPRALHRLHRRGARHHRRRLGDALRSSGAATRPMGDAAAPDARLRRAVPRIALACLVMGVRARPRRAAGSAPALADRCSALPRAGRCSSRVGMASYAVAVLATGGLRLADVRAALRRGR